MHTRDENIVNIGAENTAQAFLELLALRGVEYFFANAGTDFASVCDGFALRQKNGKELPRPVTVAHEVPLISMAYGYYLATGRPQVAMVHVGIGTANALGPIINASKARVPILFFAGRTPITEQGEPGSRSAFIHWGQEAFDQAAMVREYVKWDYELRNPRQLEAVLDRAMAMAMTEPRGPVYLTLPREVLAAKWPDMPVRPRPRLDVPTFYPDPAKIERAAHVLVRSRFPLIVTSALGRNHESVGTLVSLAEKEGIGVVSFNPEYMNFPRDHVCHLGFNSAPYVNQADTILVIDSDVPWYPNAVSPQDSATVIQAGIDPLYSSYPIRTFPSDITVQGESQPILQELARAMQAHPERDDDLIRDRKERLRSEHEKLVEHWDACSLKGAQAKPLDFRWVSRIVRERLNDQAIVINEYDNGMKENMGLDPGSYFGISHAGYLGWGVGTALGAALAKPGSMTVATVGDGSYIFAVPSACHQVSSSLNLPILVIVYDNQGYAAVKGATLGVHPDGWAAETNNFPLSRFDPPPDYEKICEAFGGYGEKVTEPDQVGPALDRAIHAVVEEKRQAVLNMVCESP